MHIDEIVNLHTKKAIERHNLDITEFKTKQELSAHLRKLNTKTFLSKNREKYNQYYRERYNKLSMEERRLLFQKKTARPKKLIKKKKWIKIISYLTEFFQTELIKTKYPDLDCH